MDRHTERVFIDTNMLMFAAQFRKYDVFSWFNELYANLWIHIDVLNEMLLDKSRVQSEIDAGHWQLFDPSTDLSLDEQLVYSTYVNKIKNAFTKLNEQREAAGKRVKTTANTGEISTLAVCLTEDAHIICSNDFDIRDVVKAQHYSYIDDDLSEHLIVQDTAEDFCFECARETWITKSMVRHFYKTLFDSDSSRSRALKKLDKRLDTLS